MVFGRVLLKFIENEGFMLSINAHQRNPMSATTPYELDALKQRIAYIRIWAWSGYADSNFFIQIASRL